MLTEDQRVHLRLGHAEVLAEEGAEARRVEEGARANDTLARETALLHRDLRQNIHGVGHDEQDGIGWQGDFAHLREDRAEERHIAVDQRQTRLIRLAPQPRGDDDHIRARDLVIASGGEELRVRQRCPMPQIERFPLGLLRHHVHQRDLACPTNQLQSVGRVRPHSSRPTNNADLHLRPLSHRNAALRLLRGRRRPRALPGVRRTLLG